MRVGLELTALLNPIQGGVARATRHLLRGMLERVGSPGGPSEVRAYYRRSRWSRRAARVQDPRLATPGFLGDWIQEPVWPLRRPVDVVHGPDARVPLWRSAARVATVNDVFSLQTDRFASAKFRRRMCARYHDLARRCQRIVTISACTRHDFLEHVDYPAERVDVVHLGVDPRFHPVDDEQRALLHAAYDLPRPYVLFVGELSPRKNLVRLVQAFGESELARDHDLLLVGGETYGSEEVHAAVTALSGRARVRLPGRVPDPLLPALYAEARLLALPSCYEGFGLPVLEAMASGTPVLAGDAGALPEVSGGHAVLADPEDVGSIRDGLLAARRLGDDPQALAQAREHAASFTWARNVDGVLATYRRALGG